jgi:hypothetical protein
VLQQIKLRAAYQATGALGSLRARAPRYRHPAPPRAPSSARRTPRTRACRARHRSRCAH